MKIARFAARLGMAVAVVASTLAVAQAPAAASGIDVGVRIGPSGPEAWVAQGDVDPVASVKGVVAGTTLDLEGCAVDGLDPASAAAGSATLTLSGCAGSDATFELGHETGTGTGSTGSGSLRVNTGPAVRFQYWCEWIYVYGIPYWDCYYRFTAA